MAQGPQGEHVEIGTATVTLDGSGNGTQAVTYQTAFVSSPSVLIVPPEADAGSWTAASASKTGFTATATTSDLTSQDRVITWVAVEKG